jgi:hypothetical protein
MAVQQTGRRQFESWEKLLREFDALDRQGTPENPELIAQARQLLREFEARQGAWREEQRTRADNFNVLRTMRLSRRELCHSDILAWLLDANGSHAQGNLGFRLFLEQFDLPGRYADMDYTVHRELFVEESQIDIVIQAKGGFIIGIENKIDAEEGDNQTEREWCDLLRRQRQLGIKAAPHAFFLTPDETMPRSENFRMISWQLIANVFEAFAAQSKAAMVKMFTSHYAETIRREIAPEPVEPEL